MPQAPARRARWTICSAIRLLLRRSSQLHIRYIAWPDDGLRPDRTSGNMAPPMPVQPIRLIRSGVLPPPLDVAPPRDDQGGPATRSGSGEKPPMSLLCEGFDAPGTGLYGAARLLFRASLPQGRPCGPRCGRHLR
jgi:hypothetical protein